MVALVVGLSLAQTPAYMDANGLAHASGYVPQDISLVRAALADPELAASLPPEVLSVRTVAGGSCVTLGVTVKGVWDPLQYTTRRCPTAGGFRYQLLSSESITAYDAEWTLTPHAGGGTDVAYNLRIELDLPVPRALVHRGVLQSAKDTVLALVHRVTGR